jgi:hypothetical protein
VPTARLVGRLLAISLPLYFAWEMLQMPAFTGTPPGWLVNTLMCVLATLLDAALVLGLYGVGVGVFAIRSGSGHHGWVDTCSSFSWPSR